MEIVKEKRIFVREKAKQFGTEALSDCELISLLLNTGTRNMDVLQLANRLLFGHGGLRSTLEAEFQDIVGYGIGDAKALRLLAVKEFIRRIPLLSPLPIHSPKEAYYSLKLCFFGLKTESILLFVLQETGEIEAARLVKGYNRARADLCIGALCSLTEHARSKNVVIIHNHPSGNSAPSETDIRTTKAINLEMKKIGIKLLDSLIFCEEDFCSILHTKDYRWRF